MPEGPEICIASRFINTVCQNRFFTGKVIKSEANWKNPDVPWNANLYSISAASRGKELKLTLISQEPKPEISRNPDHNIDNDNRKYSAMSGLQSKNIIFRFGMSGRFCLDNIKEQRKHAHLNFYSFQDDMVLSFVDVRRFGGWTVDGTWQNERGPCVMFEYTEFRRNVLQNLTDSAFDRPICEVLLNQKYFNGIGNYLRAEILFRAGIPPFTKSRSVLQDLVSVDLQTTVKQDKPDLLMLCNTVPLEVIALEGSGYDSGSPADGEGSSFRSWLQCYYQPNMNKMKDANGRTIWFSGPAGNITQKGSRKKTVKSKQKLLGKRKHEASVSTDQKEVKLPRLTKAKKKDCEDNSCNIKEEIYKGTHEDSVMESKSKPRRSTRLHIQRCRLQCQK